MRKNLIFFQNNATSIKDIWQTIEQVKNEFRNCLGKIHEQIQAEEIDNIGNNLSLTKTNMKFREKNYQ